jgi:hypothetical protein
VGGVYYVRDYAGTRNLPLTPVPPDKQRAALKLLATGVFAADSFAFKPEFLRSMGINYLDIGTQGFSAAKFNPDFSLRSRVLALQTGALNQLLSDAVLTRLLDSETKVVKSDRHCQGFAGAVVDLEQLKTGGNIPSARPDLQREHLRRITNVLTRPSSSTPADASALFREEAKQLAAHIRLAAVNGNRDAATRAHLIESAGSLEEALKAPIIRQGV